MTECAPEMPLKSALAPMGAESVRRCSSVPPMREGAHFGAGLIHPGQVIPGYDLRPSRRARVGHIGIWTLGGSKYSDWSDDTVSPLDDKYKEVWNRNGKQMTAHGV